MRYAASLSLAFILCVAIAEPTSAGGLPDCGVFRIGWSLNPPKDGEIRELYWATTNYTEVWMTLTPRQPTRGKPGVPDLLLVFSICFAGKAMPSRHDSIELRVQANRNFIAAMVPDPRLQIRIDGQTRYELTGADFKHWIEYSGNCSPGDICVYTAVLVELPIILVRGLTAATTITGDLSGTAFEITDLQRQHLAAFLERIAKN